MRISTLAVAADLPVATVKYYLREGLLHPGVATSATQATYDDWLLYYFAQDAEAGDLNGQGVSNVWYVVGPDGTVIKGAEDTGSGY